MLSLTAIGEILGVGRNAVRRHAEEIGLGPRHAALVADDVWDPPPGMVKRVCKTCRHTFAARDEAQDCPTCRSKGVGRGRGG